MKTLLVLSQCNAVWESEAVPGALIWSLMEPQSRAGSSPGPGTAPQPQPPEALQGGDPEPPEKAPQTPLCRTSPSFPGAEAAPQPALTLPSRLCLSRPQLAHLRATMVAPALPPTLFLPPFAPLRGLLSCTYAPCNLCDLRNRPRS